MNQTDEKTVIDISTDDFGSDQLGLDIKKNECLAFHKKLHAITLEVLKKNKALTADQLNNELGFL